MKYLRIIIGLVFWCGLFGALGVVAGQGRSTPALGQPYLADLWGYYSSTRRLELRLPKAYELSPGDPVFAVDPNGLLQQVGIIVSIREEHSSSPDREDTATSQAVLFPSAPS